ncbi:MAG: VOC family protein [Sphingomonas sp.]|nr:VOC family protein [Sphingomonas sp.]
MDMDLQEPGRGLTPHLAIGGGRAAEAIEFYGKAFGATELMRHAADDGRLMHAHLKVNGASLMLHDHFEEHHGGAPLPDPAGVVVQLEGGDADGWWNRSIKAGATTVMELADQFWGDRYGQLRDPFGHIWSIGAPSPAPQD